MNGSAAPVAPPRSPWLIAMVVTLATFMEVLDTTITNVSLPHIAGNLSVSQDESTWVLTSYLVSNAVVLPLSGWLSGIFGRKRFYMACVLLFTLSSALCGMATSLGMLVFFRVIQGVGGGGLQPSEQAILVDTFPLSQRGMAMAIYMIAILVAPVLGPTLGGYITDNASWRWVFYINVPVGVLSLTLTYFLLEDPPYLKEQVAARRGQPIRVDYIGLGLIALGLAALEIVLDKGQEDDWFASRLIIALTVIAVIALAAAIVWELRHPEPIINLRLLKEQNFLFCALVVFFTYAVLYGSTVLLPQMLQTLMGYTATQAGLVLSPAGIVTMLEMPIIGYLLGRRLDARILVATGLCIVAAAAHWMASLDIQMAPMDVIMPRIVQVLGAGMLFVPINTVAYQNIPRAQVNNASGLFNLIRNEGSSIGVAAVTTLLARRLQLHHVRLAEHITAYDPITRARLGPLVASGHPGALHAALARLGALIDQQASQLSYLDAFNLFAVVTLCVLPLVFFMKKPKAGAAADVPAH